MDTHTATEPGPTDDGPEAPPQAETKLLAPPRPEVSDEDFGVVVSGALEAVGGALLFKVRAGSGDEAMHVAAAAVGAGDARQFLLLSLPVVGGKLKVESASRSKSPLAKLAEAYVGVVEAFRSAA